MQRLSENSSEAADQEQEAENPADDKEPGSAVSEIASHVHAENRPGEISETSHYQS